MGMHNDDYEIGMICKITDVNENWHNPYRLDSTWWCSEDELELVGELVEEREEKGVMEKLGKTVDEAIKESPIVIQQFTELKKKYDELNKKYDELKKQDDSLYEDYKYLDGYVDGMKYILDINKEEN